MRRGGGCRRRCQRAGARPQGLPPSTGEALSWPGGSTSDGLVPGLAQGGLLRPGAAVEVGWADGGLVATSHLDLGRREGSVSLGDREDEGTVRKASTSSPPSTAFQPLGQNPARCPRGPSGAGPGDLLPSSSLPGPACVLRPGGLEGCAHPAPTPMLTGGQWWSVVHVLWMPTWGACGWLCP